MNNCVLNQTTGDLFLLDFKLCHYRHLLISTATVPINKPKTTRLRGNTISVSAIEPVNMLLNRPFKSKYVKKEWLTKEVLEAYIHQEISGSGSDYSYYVTENKATEDDTQNSVK
jgi:hypothetical protein